ncbi:polysaccharide biosynthesis C-terminal domain-containing protein [Nocardiopsis sp. RSe5-2]|uniref:Polysaccharide biosynthesis C-terminal domain-containing protein n=1 Tax=Nocardiopsis endophytica TaxID=3018445 RepID=A0ABT4U2Q9_9ACTN|nr:polysaccharide biosynthesis C-terminal domain-containing protein [Nocardiopsis endophytica]MDA2811243.1 polysaccharide biosynthesis C-terminal domain-containing protein [Nocardiopsis endophytica]
MATESPTPTRGGGEDRGGAEAVARTARGGALNMAAAVAGAGLNLALVVAVARGFSQDTAGLLFAATSVFLIASAVAQLGTANGLVYFLARTRALGAAGQARHLLRTALVPVAAASLALAAAMAVFAGPVAEAAGEPGAAVYLRLLAAFLPFAAVTEALLAATRAHHDMAATAVVEKVGRPLGQVLLVLGAAGVGSAGLLAVAWAGPYLPAAVVAALWLRRVVRKGAPPLAAGTGPQDQRPATAPTTPREFWGFTLPRSVAQVAQIGNQRAGIVLVAAVQGAASAAVFTAGTRLLVAGQFATQAVQFAAGPRMAEMLAVDDREGTARLYRSATAWLICLTWPLFLPAVVYAPLVMELFGPGYAGAAGTGVLVVVAVAQMASASLGMGDLLLTMAGRTGWNLANNLMSLAANVVLCVVLIPPLGAVGAALAWAAAIGVRNLLPLVQLHRMIGVHPFSPRWTAAAGAALAWFGAVPAVCAGVLGTTGPSLVLALMLGGSGWAATVWRMRTVLDLDGLLPKRWKKPTPAPTEAH